MDPPVAGVHHHHHRLLQGRAWRRSTQEDLLRWLGLLLALLLRLPGATDGQSAPLGEGFHRIREYCESESFRPRCGSNEVIVMETATYGRMRLGRCVTTDLGYLGCSSNVMSIADSRCSGRRQCQVRIPDPEMDATQPCFKELKIYFTASYACIPVVTPTTTRCHGEQVVRTHSQWGYLASMTTVDTGCGSHESPWILEAPDGHRLNITLFDFMSYAEHQARYFPTDHHCFQYGEVMDNQDGTSMAICRGSHRVKHVMVSKGNRVSLVLTLSKKDVHAGMFVIKYEVLGCKYNTGDCGQELVPEPCSGSNCTQHASSSYKGKSHNLHFLGQGASIAIILCISITVSLLMLVLGAVLLKCHKIGRGPFWRRRRAGTSGALTEQERRACVYTEHVGCDGTTNLTGFNAREYEIRTCYFDPRCAEYVATRGTIGPTKTTTALTSTSPDIICKESPHALPPPATTSTTTGTTTLNDPYLLTSSSSATGCRTGPHTTTCTLEMETTSGLVLRGVLSKMEDVREDCCGAYGSSGGGGGIPGGGGTCPDSCPGSRMSSQRYKPEGDETPLQDAQEGVNLYLFSDNSKLQELPEDFSPELERKVMVI